MGAVLACDAVYYAVRLRCFLLLSLWTKSQSVTIQMKATEQYFPMSLLIMLFKVIITVESVDAILMCNHSNESY